MMSSRRWKNWPIRKSRVLDPRDALIPLLPVILLALLATHLFVEVEALKSRGQARDRLLLRRLLRAPLARNVLGLEVLHLRERIQSLEETLVPTHLARKELREVPMFPEEAIAALMHPLGAHLREAPREMTMAAEGELTAALMRLDPQGELIVALAPLVTVEETLPPLIATGAEETLLPLIDAEVVEALIVIEEVMVALLNVVILTRMIEIIVLHAMIEMTTTRRDRGPPTKTTSTIAMVLTQNVPTTEPLHPHHTAVEIPTQSHRLHRNPVAAAVVAAVFVKCRRTK